MQEVGTRRHSMAKMMDKIAGMKVEWLDEGEVRATFGYAEVWARRAGMYYQKY